MLPGYRYPFFGKTIEFVKDTLAVCADHYERFGPVSRLDMVKNQRVLMCLGPEFNEATLFDPMILVQRRVYGFSWAYILMACFFVMAKT